MAEPSSDPWQLLRATDAALDPRVRELAIRLQAPDAAAWLDRVLRGETDGSETGNLVATALQIAARLGAEGPEAMAGTPRELLVAVWTLLAEQAPEPAASLATHAYLRQDAARPETVLAGSSPGRRIGRYELLAVIGCGASSAVYRARHCDNGRLAAVKVLRLDAMAPDQFTRFRQEARIVARLHHPAIVQILDSGVHEEGGLATPYIVSELIEGMPMAAALRTRPLAAVLTTMIEVSDAIAHAHANTVLHRDIKPANVLVDAAGHAHVIDFGIARGTEVSGAGTRSGVVLGTPGFLSPEQAAGHPVDERTDVWGLGALLYAILTGEAPHAVHGLGPVEALRRAAEDAPRSLCVVRPDLPAGVTAVVDRALAIAPDDRYPSVAELGRDLHRLLAGDPVAAQPPSWWQSARRLARRHRLACTMILAIALAITIGGVVAAVAWRQAVLAEEATRIAVTEAHDALQTGIAIASDLAETATPTEQQMVRIHEALASIERIRRLPALESVDRWLRSEARLRELAGDLHLRAGDPAAARHERVRVLALQQELSGLGSDELLDRARALIKLGDLDKETHPELAWQDYLAAHQLLLQRGEAPTSDLKARDDLGWSYERLAGMARVMGRGAEALDLARRRVALAETLHAANPDALREYGLASGLAVLALSQLTVDDGTSGSQVALDCYRRGCGHALVALRLDPARRPFALLVLTLHRLLGDAERRWGDAARAPAAFATARSIGNDLLARDDRDVDTRTAMAVVECQIGILAAEAGDFAAAEIGWCRAHEHGALLQQITGGNPARGPLTEAARTVFERVRAQGDVPTTLRWGHRVGQLLKDITAAETATAAELATTAIWLVSEAPEALQDRDLARDLARRCAHRAGFKDHTEELDLVARALRLTGLTEEAQRIEAHKPPRGPAGRPAR